MLRDMHPPHTAVTAFDSYEEEQVLIAAESLRQKIRRRCDHLTPGTVQYSTRTYTDTSGSYSPISCEINEIELSIRLYLLCGLVTLSLGTQSLSDPPFCFQFDLTLFLFLVFRRAA